MENPDNLSGGPMVSGEGGDLSVCRDFPAGDRFDYAFGPVLEFHAEPGNRILVLSCSNVKYPQQAFEVASKYKQAFAQAQFLKFRQGPLTGIAVSSPRPGPFFRHPYAQLLVQRTRDRDLAPIGCYRVLARRSGFRERNR